MAIRNNATPIMDRINALVHLDGPPLPSWPPNPLPAIGRDGPQRAWSGGAHHARVAHSPRPGRWSSLTEGM